MWSGSGSERTRSITGLNFKGGPSVAPNLADAGTQGLRKKGGRFKAGGGRWPYYAPNPLRGGAAKGLGIKEKGWKVQGGRGQVALLCS